MGYHLYYTLFGIEHHVSKEEFQRPVSMHDVHAALIVTKKRWVLCFFWVASLALTIFLLFVHAAQGRAIQLRGFNCRTGCVTATGTPAVTGPTDSKSARAGEPPESESGSDGLLNTVTASGFLPNTFL
jgi:hypothetical protein